MMIDSISIKSVRSFADETLYLNAYTSFVGPMGEVSQLLMPRPKRSVDRADDRLPPALNSFTLGRYLPFEVNREMGPQECTDAR